MSSSRLRRVAASIDERLVARLARERGEVGQGALLRVARVLQERARRADRERQVLAAESREVLRAELRRSARAAPRPRRNARAGARRVRAGDVDACTPSGSSSSAGRRRSSSAASDSRPSPSSTLKRPAARSSQARPKRSPSTASAASRFSRLRVEQRVVGDRARRHDAHDLARDRALGLADLAGLFADRDRLALLHEPGQVAVELLDRHARHRDRARRPTRRAGSGRCRAASSRGARRRRRARRSRPSGRTGARPGSRP